VSLSSILSDTPAARTFELVVANILFQPLLDMVQPLAASVEKHLILSGILDSQVEALIAAYQDQGLSHARTRLKEEWAVLEFIR
jgi:ribosomal protein L11 methyltransferase